MKRILVFTTQLLETGGIESHLLEFCKQLHAHGLVIDLVVLNADVNPENATLYQHYCNKIFWGKGGNSLLKAIWLLSTALRLTLLKYDALYTNGQGESIQKLRFFIRLKGVWVHHHHTSGDPEDQGTWGKVYWKALRSCDTLVACSGRSAVQMTSTLARKVCSVPCFSREIKLVTKFREAGKVKLGYFGRLIPEKGIDTICELSREEDLSNVEFHIWGKGEAYPALFFGQFPNVIYHGSFSDISGLQEAISSIDGLLLLSIHPEGLPISLLEAMSAGLPWLATNKGGIADIACDPLSTRIIPADSKFSQIKEAIASFINDIQDGKISREKQQKLYAQYFSAPALVKKWCKTLHLEKF